MGKYIKKEKKLLNLVVSKQESHNVTHKTAIKIGFNFSTKRKRFFIADTNLQVDEISRKLEANSNKPLFI